jgi:quinoprotein glucose dehydrogenase
MEETQEDPVTRLLLKSIAKMSGGCNWPGHYRAGDVSDGTDRMSKSKFEATPILFNGSLYVSTPFNRVIALDPSNGKQRWTFDPKVDLKSHFSEGLVSRGVSAWEDPSVREGAGCKRTIFLGTIDARLIALDADSGKPCPRFGSGGQIDLKNGIGKVELGEYGVTSPPAVVNGVVVVGSAIGDNRRVNLERGTVRAFDAKTGAQRWQWDPLPPGTTTGAANAWGPMASDAAMDLVFVPTGSASPDFYGGERPGDDLFANCVVALRASTGQVVWHFQVVHRATGKPLFPVEERAVPKSDVAGELASRTQPYDTPFCRLRSIRRLFRPATSGAKMKRNATLASN